MLWHFLTDKKGKSRGLLVSGPTASWPLRIPSRQAAEHKGRSLLLHVNYAI